MCTVTLTHSDILYIHITSGIKNEAEAKHWENTHETQGEAV